MPGTTTRVASRAVMLAPFLLGGLAGAWLATTSTSTILVAIGWAAAMLAAAAIALLLTAAPADRRHRSRLATADGRGERWPARPLWSSMVRGITVLAPVGMSVSAALALQEVLPPPRGGGSTVGHVLILLVCGFGVLYPAEQATRRLAPITMLLKLSLAFPSAAPSRFKVARRSGSVTSLQRRLRAASVPDDRARTEVAGTLLSLVAALTAHDSRTRGHSERVRVFSEMLALELGVDDPSRERLRWSALLHDIGKMAVSADVLNKPGPLDERQWKEVRRHPEIGADLVAPLAPWLGEWGAAVAQHHERLDGTGYPLGLEREQISLGARIIAVADAFDTMVSPRPYSPAMTPAAARQEVARVSASQFDPRVVRALMSLSIPRLWWRIGLAAWLAHLPLLGRGSSRPKAARNPMPLAGMLSLVAAAVVLSASGLLGTQGFTPGPGSLAMPPELDSSTSGTITVGPAPAEAALPEVDGEDPEAEDAAAGAGSAVGQDPVETAPAGGGGEAKGAGGQADGQGSTGGAGAGGDGGGGTVGGSGTVIDANEDVTFAGEEEDSPVGVQAGPPTIVPPPGQGSPPATPPPAEEESSGGDGEDDGPHGGGHGYGHDKGRGKGHENHDDA